MGVAMDIRKHMAGKVAVISLVGRLDSHSAADVHASMLESLTPRCQILLDFSKVVCLSEDGLRTALVLYRQAQRLDSWVALVGLSAELRNVLAATGYLGFFLVTETVADAIPALQLQAAGRHQEQQDEQPALRA
jgi:anti-sigma B factor antagonist